MGEVIFGVDDRLLNGENTASVEINCEMGARSAGDVRTETRGSFSFAALPQPPMPKSSAPIADTEKAKLFGYACKSSSEASWSCQHPCKSLQIGQRHAIAHGTVLVSAVGLSIGGLCVDHFEHRGFAIFVAQRDEPQALGCKFGGAVEASEFVQRGFRFRVERPYLSESCVEREKARAAPESGAVRPA